MSSDKVFRQHGVFFAALTFAFLLALPILPDAAFGWEGVASVLFGFSLVFGFAAFVYYFLGMPIFWGLTKAGWSNVWSYILIGVVFGIFILTMLDMFVPPFDAPVQSYFDSPGIVLLYSLIGGAGGANFWFFVARPSGE